MSSDDYTHELRLALKTHNLDVTEFSDVLLQQSDSFVPWILNTTICSMPTS
jgi:hypothetical protein